MERRIFIKIIAGAAIAPSNNLVAEYQRQGTEKQTPEPGEQVEELIFDEDRFSYIFNQALGKPKDRTAFCERMVEVANGFADAGVSRTNNPKQVLQFLQLFGFDLTYPNGKFVPYCACGVSYAAAQAICDIAPKEPYDAANPLPKFKEALTSIRQFYFFPHPAVWKIKERAEFRHSWLPRDGTVPKKGWLVIFDWDGDKIADHIGLVDRLEGKSLHTVEFNTVRTVAGNQRDGGAVAQRERSLDPVMGYIRLY